jgi:hypothetical protein
MHPFYQKPKFIQWSVALILFSLLLVVCYGWFQIMQKSVFSIFLLLVLAPLMQLCCSPLFTLLGMYKYVSPMLLIYAPSAAKYDLHNGTSFDYLTVLGGKMKRRSFQRVILRYYLQGLLEIIREIEAGETPETIEIIGTSYFFSENTARRMGFELHPAESSTRFNIYLNYLDLLWMYSLSKRKLTFPNLKEIKLAKTTGKVLKENKPAIEQLYLYLGRPN